MVTRGADLALRDVHVRYDGGSVVLDGVDLTLGAGRRVALIGPNGSGKTTLLRTLSGALAPGSGHVALGEERLGRRRAQLGAHRRRVQLVLQDPDDQLFSADVHSEVSYGPTNLGLGTDAVRERVAATLDVLGISDLVTRPVHHLSFGQRKRVAIAGAVAMRPEHLLLDEPTAGLDPAGAASLLRCLARLETLGTTVTLSTHDMGLVWEWADDVALLHAGHVHAGAPAAVLGDAERLAAADLDVPWQAALLRAAGLPLDEPRPRERDAVIAAALAPARAIPTELRHP